MRCPKCQYISFDNNDRCRNCGYEFSLVVDDAQVEVKIAREEPASSRNRDGAFTALDTPIDPRAAESPVAPFRRSIAPADLPLFVERVADDQAPLVTPPAVPRPPLSVRKAAPLRPRPQTTVPEELSLNLDDDDETDPLDQFAHAPLPSAPPAREIAPSVDERAAASLGRRCAAGVIDVIILGSISLAVVLLTLRVVGLEQQQWRILPVAPMLAFLLLLSGGYFVLFTAAGGQTIGKMAARIRVVNSPGISPARVSFATAVIRTIACLGSVLALGTGFLFAIFSDDRCAFHDRIADTRVVPA